MFGENEVVTSLRLAELSDVWTGVSEWMSCLHHHNPTSFGMRWVRLNSYLDALTKGIQKPEKSVDAIPLDSASDQGGYFWLVKSKQIGGLRLSEFLLSDEVSDALDKFGLGESQVRIRKAEVGKHIAASLLEMHWFLTNDLVLRAALVRSIPHGVSLPPSVAILPSRFVLVEF